MGNIQRSWWTLLKHWYLRFVSIMEHFTIRQLDAILQDVLINLLNLILTYYQNTQDAEVPLPTMFPSSRLFLLLKHFLFPPSIHFKRPKKGKQTTATKKTTKKKNKTEKQRGFKKIGLNIAIKHPVAFKFPGLFIWQSGLNCLVSSVASWMIRSWMNHCAIWAGSTAFILEEKAC